MFYCDQNATMECKSLVLALAYITRHLTLDQVDAIPLSNTSYQYTLSSTHLIKILYQLPLSTCPLNTPSQPVLSTLPIQQVKAASRLEEEFQVEIWGVVEGGTHWTSLAQYCLLRSFLLAIALDKC